jgi:hypothetical protein
VRDVLTLDPTLRRNVVFASRRSNAPLIIFVYDGVAFGSPGTVAARVAA